MTEINNFDVLKEMGNRDMKSLHLFPTGNFKRAQTGKDTWGEVVMAVDNKTIIEMTNNKPQMILLVVVDTEDFEKVKSEMKE